jgi:hypothetical protein
MRLVLNAKHIERCGDTYLLAVAQEVSGTRDLSQGHGWDRYWQGDPCAPQRLQLRKYGFRFEIFQSGPIAHDVVTRHGEEHVAGGGGSSAIPRQHS